MGVNGQKLYFQANGGRWRDNGVETAWISFLSVYIIAIVSINNIFVNKSGGGVKGSPICRRKWGKMAKNQILREMAGDGETMGWKQPGIAFSPYVLLQKHPVITFLSIKVKVGSRGRP